jgi:predicted O-linked N-acetylglucosamine transferase (SPINDLY family)
MVAAPTQMTFLCNHADGIVASRDANKALDDAATDVMPFYSGALPSEEPYWRSKVLKLAVTLGQQDGFADWTSPISRDRRATRETLLVL